MWENRSLTFLLVLNLIRYIFIKREESEEKGVSLLLHLCFGDPFVCHDGQNLVENFLCLFEGDRFVRNFLIRVGEDEH
jgi:hypothetical protein